MENTQAAAGGAAASLAVRSASRRPNRQLDGPSWQGYAFVGPAVLILGVFLLLPAAWIFWLSLYHWDLIAQNPDFVGLENFRILLTHDSTFRKALIQTTYYVVVTVPVGMAVGLGLALLLNARLRGQGAMRAAIFSPYVMPLVATAIIWGWILNPDFGVLNAALKALHVPTSQWLGRRESTMPAIILYGLWQHVGYNTVIFLAGLANLPPEIEEAAHVDGARAWSTFWRIKWPLLSPTTYFVLLISMIGSFKVVMPVIVLVGNQGGPDNAAMTIGLYLYDQAFVSFHAGYAGAISVVLFLVILAITLAQTQVLSRRVSYQ